MEFLHSLAVGGTVFLFVCFVFGVSGWRGGVVVGGWVVRCSVAECIFSVLCCPNKYFRYVMSTYWRICNKLTHLTGMVESLKLRWEYWIELVTMEPPCTWLTFPARIICRGVSGFGTGCPCGVWCRGLTTYPTCSSTFWQSYSKWIGL